MDCGERGPLLEAGLCGVLERQPAHGVDPVAGQGVGVEDEVLGARGIDGGGAKAGAGQDEAAGNWGSREGQIIKEEAVELGKNFECIGL